MKKNQVSDVVLLRNSRVWTTFVNSADYSEHTQSLSAKTFSTDRKRKDDQKVSAVWAFRRERVAQTNPILINHSLARNLITSILTQYDLRWNQVPCHNKQFVETFCFIPTTILPTLGGLRVTRYYSNEV